MAEYLLDGSTTIMSTIIRQPLFDDSDKKQIGETLATLERLAAEEIARHPEKRDEILQRLNRASTKFVAARVYHQRKMYFITSLITSIIGGGLVWLGGAVDVQLLMTIGGVICISGFVTALISIPRRHETAV